MVALFLERGIAHFIRLFVYLCWRQVWAKFVVATSFACYLCSPLECFYAKVCSRSCSRTSNIHTLHSLVICARRLNVFMRKFVAAHVLERVISIHSIRLLFVFNSPLECLGVSFICLWAPSFRTRNLVVTHLFWLKGASF